MLRDAAFALLTSASLGTLTTVATVRGMIGPAAGGLVLATTGLATMVVASRVRHNAPTPRWVAIGLLYSLVGGLLSVGGVSIVFAGVPQ